MPTKVQLWKIYISKVSNPRPLKQNKCSKAQLVAELARLDSQGSNQVVSPIKLNKPAKKAKATKAKKSNRKVTSVFNTTLSNTTGITGVIAPAAETSTNRDLLNKMSFKGVKHIIEKLKLRIPKDASKDDIINIIHDKQMIFPLSLEDYEMYKRLGPSQTDSLCRDVNIDPIGVSEDLFYDIIEDSRIRPMFIHPIKINKSGRLSQRELKSIVKKVNTSGHPRWIHNLESLREMVCVRTDQDITGAPVEQILTIINMKAFQPKKKTKKIIPLPIIIETHSDSETETDLCEEQMPMPFEYKITPGEICDDDSKQSELGNDAELNFNPKPVWYKGENIALKGLTTKDIPKIIKASKQIIIKQTTLKPVWFRGENIALRGLSSKDIPKLIKENKTGTKIMRLRGGSRNNRRTISQAGYGKYVALALALGRPREGLLRIGSNVRFERWVAIITALEQNYNEIFDGDSHLAAGTYHYRMVVYINGRAIDVPVPGPFETFIPMTEITLKARIYEDAQDRIARKYESLMASSELTEIILNDVTMTREVADLFSRGAIMSALYAAFGETSDQTDANCVVQMIFDCYQKASKDRRVVTKTRDTIEDQFKEICCNFNRGVTTNEILEWAERYTDNVCVFAINPYDQRVFKKLTGRGRASINVTFVVYNGHVYPITSPAIQRAVRSTGLLELEKVYWQTCPVNPLIYPEEYELDMCIIGREEEKEDYEEEDCDNLDLEFPAHDWIVIKTGIEQILQKVIIKHNVLVDHVKFSKGNVVAFQHPISGSMFSQSADFEDREALCESLYTAFDLENFAFSNQGYSEIAKTAFKHICGVLRESEYSAEAMSLSDSYSTSPINTHFDQDWTPFPTKIFDANRFYRQCCVDNTEDFPVFTAFDQIKPYLGADIKCGEYILKEFKSNGITFKCQMWGWGAVKELLYMEIITRDDILMERVARITTRHDIMREFIERMEELVDSKKLINTMIGCLNTKERRFETGMICLSYEEALAHLLDRVGKGEEATINTVVYEDLTTWHIRSMKSKRLQTDNAPIWRAIISNSHIKIIKLMKDLQAGFGFGKTTLVAIHTDAVYVENPCLDFAAVLAKHDWKVVDAECFTVVDDEKTADIVVKSTSDPNNDYSLLDEAFVTINNAVDFPNIFFEPAAGHLLQNIWEDYFTHNMRSMPTCIHVPSEEPDLVIFEPKDWNVVDETFRGSMLITGDAGSGKTTFIRELYREFILASLTVMLLTFTNVARVNIMDGNEDIDKADVMTLDMFFLEKADNPRRIPDVFIVDEVSQVNKKHMKCLYDASVRNPATLFIFCGDFKQCLAVEVDGIRYDWMENDTFRKLVGHNHYAKPFVPEYGRYNQQYYDVLQEFIETKKLPDYFRNRPLVRSIDLSMVYTNACRDEVIREKRLDLQADWEVGMKIIVCGDQMPKSAVKFFRELDIFNNSRWEIEQIVGNKALINQGIEIPLAYILPLFASTVYKNQAVTIEDHVNIFQIERMDINQAYTALSRVRNGDQIHLKHTTKEFLPIVDIDNKQFDLKEPRVKNVWIHNGKVQEKWTNENDIPGRILFDDRDDFDRIVRNKNAINKAQMAPQEARRKFVTKIKKFFSHRLGHHTCYKVTVRGNYDGYKHTERITFDHNSAASMHTAYLRAVELAAVLADTIEFRQEKIKKAEFSLAEENTKKDRKYYKMPPREYTLEDDHVPRKPDDLQTYGVFKSLDWFGKEAPVDILPGRTIKWVEPAKYPTKKYPYSHSYATASKELILEQLDNIEGVFYGYEILDHDVRLFVDVDKELEEEEKVDIGYYIGVVTKACIDVAATYGTHLKQEDFRYLNATTETKLSLHITNVAVVFQTTTCQEEYWIKVGDALKDIDGCWFGEDNKKCIVDLKVYTKHRPMRTIHASKPGKDNRLVPVDVEGQNLEQYVTEDYLISVEDWINDYTILSSEKELKNQTKNNRGTAVQIGIVPDDIREWLNLNPVEGFDTDRVQWDGSTARLTRTSSSHCQECNKTHDNDNARFEFNLATHEVKYRCFRGKIPIHMGFY